MTIAEELLIPVIPVTDCRSLYDSLQRLTMTIQEKRILVDLAAIRESCACFGRGEPGQVGSNGPTGGGRPYQDLDEAPLRTFIMEPTLHLVARAAA